MKIKEKVITEYIMNSKLFTTRDFASMIKENEIAYSERDVYRLLHRLQDEGSIMKVGHGHYAKMAVKTVYQFKPSMLLQEITEYIREVYPLVTFDVWEMYQWNEFVNHQYAHNAFFIEVENQLSTTVFESLREKYDHVLLRPDIENYYRYHSDNMIIVQRLLTGSPSPITSTNQATLEKLLVDIFSKSLTGQLIERAEYRKIYTDAFGKYVINESALFRYAGRRHLKADIQKFIKEETDIQLKLEE